MNSYRSCEFKTAHLAGVRDLIWGEGIGYCTLWPKECRHFLLYPQCIRICRWVRTCSSHRGVRARAWNALLNRCVPSILVHMLTMPALEVRASHYYRPEHPWPSSSLYAQLDEVGTEPVLPPLQFNETKRTGELVPLQQFGLPCDVDAAEHLNSSVIRVFKGMCAPHLRHHHPFTPNLFHPQALLPQPLTQSQNLKCHIFYCW